MKPLRVQKNLSTTNTVRRNRRKRRRKQHVYLQMSAGSEADSPRPTTALVSASETPSLAEAPCVPWGEEQHECRVSFG